MTFETTHETAAQPSTAGSPAPSAQARTSARARLAGTAIERHGWVLTALMALVLLLGGIMMFTGAPDTTVSDSACCSGRSFTAAPHWTYLFAAEAAEYTATYMVASALLAFGVILTALRRGRRWAWALMWVLPVIFAQHAAALQPGAFPFDAVIGVITALGLVLMVRPVFGRQPIA